VSDVFFSTLLVLCGTDVPLSFFVIIVDHERSDRTKGTQTGKVLVSVNPPTTKKNRIVISPSPFVFVEPSLESTFALAIFIFTLLQVFCSYRCDDYTQKHAQQTIINELTVRMLRRSRRFRRAGGGVGRVRTHLRSRACFPLSPLC
jgi:hypothetical protein